MTSNDVVEPNLKHHQNERRLHQFSLLLGSWSGRLVLIGVNHIYDQRRPKQARRISVALGGKRGASFSFQRQSRGPRRPGQTQSPSCKMEAIGPNRPLIENGQPLTGATGEASSQGLRHLQLSPPH